MSRWRLAAISAVIVLWVSVEITAWVGGRQNLRWYKGNTHTHTTESDGDTPPEEVALWYRDHGYNFLVLSDHNVLTDPTLLDDHVLIRFKQISGAPFLRDVARDKIEDVVASRFRGDSRFVRLLSDHLAAMTDTFAVAEHARLTEIGAVPIPSAEQLRREQS